MDCLGIYKMSKVKTKLALLSSIVLLSGCSTMFNNGSQTMMVRGSDSQEGVKVEVQSSDGVYPTRLPATIVASPSNEGVKVTVTDKCYDRTVTTVKKRVTPSYWANILNIYGFGIDWATGDMWKYDSNTTVILHKKEECSANSETNA
jgi:hypothetical protein